MNSLDTNVNIKTTWKDVFTSGNDVVGLNLIHPRVIKLLNVNSKEELTESARKEKMSSLTDPNLNAIMFKSNCHKTAILHHNSKVGGGLLNPTINHFGLFGCGKIATPFKFKPTSILKINKIDAPSWDTIKSIKNKEDLQAARDATPNIHHFTSAIATPLFLAKALIAMEASGASDIFMEALYVST